MPVNLVSQGRQCGVSGYAVHLSVRHSVSFPLRGTEVEFYEVVRVTPKTVLLVSIQKKLLDVNGIEYTAVPIPGSGEKTPFRRWIFPSGLSEVPGCRISDSEIVFLWDGSPRRGTVDWERWKKQVCELEK